MLRSGRVRTGTKHMAFTRRAIRRLLVAFGVMIAAFTNHAAWSVPSMSRQTGMACAACHTVFPELTPFGRQFKLGGFSLSVPKAPDASELEKIPVAALLQVSRTSTRNTSTEGASSDDFPRDRDVIVQAAGLYWGGRIFDDFGALIQYNYNGIERKWGMEMFDARYGNTATVAGKSLAWGISANNGPSLSDIFNSTPMWAFPHTDTAGVMPAANAVIDMTLASAVGGVTAYGLLDGKWYLEVGGYRTANHGFWRFMALGDRPLATVIDGGAPYWRIAWQKQTGPHSFEVGTYGMRSKVFVDSEDEAVGSDRFRDIALDGQYQYITDDHQISTHATWIHEKQDWTSSYDRGLSSRPSTTLETFRADVHYFFRRQWGGGVQYFQTRGDPNDLRYNTGTPVTGSANGSPDTKGWIVELDWLPKQNLKLAVRYTAYQQFNGASSNYDGFGRDSGDVPFAVER